MAAGGGNGPRLGWASMAIMAAIARLGREATVQGIVDEIERVSDRRIAMPQMYVTLPRLERAGLLARFEVAARAVQGGRRSSRYEVTPEGVRRMETVVA